MQIIDLSFDDTDLIQQAAALLVDSFKEHWSSAWSDIDSALQEVQDFFAADRIIRVAIDNSVVIGWIGGIKQYDGCVWELHPLVVRSNFRRQGIGRTLVTDLENQVIKRGCITMTGWY